MSVRYNILSTIKNIHMKTAKKTKEHTGKGRKKSKKVGLLNAAIIGASTPAMGRTYRPGEKDWLFD